MTNKCVVCGRRGKPRGYLSFHRFPDDLEKRESWLKALKMESASKWDYVCSEHFKKSDFNIKRAGLKILKINAVPFLPLATPSPKALPILSSSLESAKTNNRKKESSERSLKKVKLSNSSMNHTVNPELLEDLYKLSPAVEVHIKSSPSDNEDEEDKSITEFPEDQMIESTENTEPHADNLENEEEIMTEPVQEQFIEIFDTNVISSVPTPPQIYVKNFSSTNKMPSTPTPTLICAKETDIEKKGAEEPFIEIVDIDAISSKPPQIYVKNFTNTKKIPSAPIPTSIHAEETDVEKEHAEETYYLSDSSTLTAESDAYLEEENPIGSEKTCNVSALAPTPKEILPSFKEFCTPKRFPMPRYFGDCLESDMDDPRRARISWNIARRTIINQKIKIRKFKTQISRLRDRVVCLNSLMKYLVSNFDLGKKN